MCGIVGIVHQDRQRPVSAAFIRAMCNTIHHRGPDDEGIWTEGRVGLGMRRLSIIDLAGGHQPIFNEDCSKCIVLNGEIYNYRQLRDRLHSSGHTFETRSDTETILHLYEDRGDDCVTDLRGMFAFAIWDGEKERLLVARDRFGIKPLYYTEAPWGIAFASELKTLVVHGLTNRQLSLDALDAYLQLGYIPAPDSPFTDVRKLEPGHVLTWSAEEGLNVRRYWDHPRARRDAPADVEQRVLDWLDGSVDAHLIADVPVAAFLSGGLDSSAVVASMAQFQQTPHAFTVRYHGRGAAEADETALASSLAGRYGAKLDIVDVHPNLEAIFDRIVWALDEPHADDSSIPTWLLSEAVAAQYKVALTGIGGDELFAGYRRHRGLLMGSWYAALPRPVRRLASAMLVPVKESGLAVNRLRRFVTAGSGSVPSRYLDYITRINDDDRWGLYVPELRERVPPNHARERFEALYAQGGDPEGLNAALYLDYKTFLADDILALSDRLSMAHSLEIRVPLVDHELLEAVFPLPDRLKIGFRHNKHLLRRALRSRLPAGHFRAPKRGFVGPTASWLRHELRAVVEGELAADRIQRLGIFQPAAVASLLTEHFSGKRNREGILWGLLCFSAWHRQFVEQQSASPYAPGASRMAVSPGRRT